MVRRRLLLLSCVSTTLAACAGLPGTDPPKVTLAGVESLPGEGMEVRMAVKLRVQNPNDQPIDYDGVAVDLEVRGMDLASGVSDVRGTVPRYGETVIGVPVTVSALRAAFNVFGIMQSGVPDQKLGYSLEGKLDGPGFGSTRFHATGELAMPGVTGAGAQ